MYNACMPINIILSYTFIIQTNTLNIVNCVAVLNEEVTSQIEHIVKVIICSTVEVIKLSSQPGCTSWGMTRKACYYKAGKSVR